MLRLRVQMERTGAPAAGANPNLLELDALNDIDRRVLKECLRVARHLQQRMELDYRR
jgi:CBS domain-containing protein